MRIAILTLPIHSNKGGILQAWALQTLLEGMGHTAEVLMPDREKKAISANVKIKRAILIAIGRVKVDTFKRNHLRLKWVEELSPQAVNGYDVLIAGSDQIWRKEYFCEMWAPSASEDAFLAFCANSNIRKMSYAASLGIDRWDYTPEETVKIKDALSHFESISVREHSAVDLIADTTGYAPTLVLDPTMLLPADRYKELVSRELKSAPGGLVSYILDCSDDKQALIAKVAEDRSLLNTEINRVNTTVKQWIASIAKADLVITDSFHGCVFSIIFGRPLIFVYNKERGNARFDSLIRTFGIAKNLVTSASGYDKDRDYSLPPTIAVTLKQLRERSIEFIRHSLMH